MKAGDLATHAVYAARVFHGRRIVFVGDGDAVGLIIAHLMAEKLISFGPNQILVLDFDERVVNTVNRFAIDYGVGDRISAKLYNVIDPLPEDIVGGWEGFHINPPWGQHNEGESVLIFFDRAIEATNDSSIGVVTIADDPTLAWTQRVIQKTQTHALARGAIVSSVKSSSHAYHLDDAPNLRSCTLLLRKVQPTVRSNAVVPVGRLGRFYGRAGLPEVHYIRELLSSGRQPAERESYKLELFAS